MPIRQSRKLSLYILLSASEASVNSPPVCVCVYMCVEWEYEAVGHTRQFLSQEGMISYCKAYCKHLPNHFVRSRRTSLKHRQPQ
jgi:hypothetical protein